MRTFLMGAFVGAAAMGLWGDRFRAQFGAQVDGAVDRVLGALDTVDDQVQSLRGRVESFATNPEHTRTRHTA